MRAIGFIVFELLAFGLMGTAFPGVALAAPPTEPVVLNDDGAWCWFQDERAVVRGSTLFVGSVANGSKAPHRRGDIDVISYDLESGRLLAGELHDQLESDDHAAPALWVRPDGRLLAVYSKHGPEDHFYSTISQSADGPIKWSAAKSHAPSTTSRITYSNLHFLATENEGRGRLYNFFRGLDATFKPSFAYSDDGGESWNCGNVLIDVPLEFRHRPYVKYASDGRDTIHLLYTDGHPRDFDNSVYHVIYRRGRLHRSDGTVIRSLAAGLRSPEEGTRVFRGDPQNVAWVSDLHLSPEGHPHAVYSIQKNSAGMPSGAVEAGQDHRYRHAWWDGNAWQDREIAHAGTRLYPGEDDYTGNICLDPNQLQTVYLSTNSDPVTGESLKSTADGKRHFEIYRGQTTDRGATWTWGAITRDSTVDNLRPMVPKWRDDRTVLLWFRGTYHTFRDYQTEVVALVFRNPPT